MVDAAAAGFAGWMHSEPVPGACQVAGYVRYRLIQPALHMAWPFSRSTYLYGKQDKTIATLKVSKRAS